MSYTITDKGKVLKLKLKSNFPYALNLDFKRNGVSVPTLTSTHANGVHTFPNISLRSWKVGDVLSDFTISAIDGQYHLYELEDITWFIDGNEFVTRNSNTFTHSGFKDVGEHTIQAVWKGNEKYTMAMTPKTTFYVKQDSSEVTPASSIYILRWTEQTKTSARYGDGTIISAKLTRGGVPITGADVLLTPTEGNSMLSSTDDNGIVEWELKELPVRKQNLYATYSVGGTVQCSCQRDMQIEKSEPNISYFRQNNSGQSSGWHVSDEVGIEWVEPTGTAINNQFLPVYINGKLQNCYTNRWGRTWIRLTQTGTFRFKATFGGDKNMNAYSKEFTIVVN